MRVARYSSFALLAAMLSAALAQQTAAFIKQEQALWGPVLRAVNEGK